MCQGTSFMTQENYKKGELKGMKKNLSKIASFMMLGLGMFSIVALKAQAELHCEWKISDGKYYWYEDGIKQGTYEDAKGVMGDGSIRGREIYDSESDGWYWLDAILDGAKATGKEVWMPYIYQDELKWDDEEIRSNANKSGGMAEQIFNAIKAHQAGVLEGSGKWVRYDENGKMLKGWTKITGSLAEIYPSQKNNVYYYDPMTGLMAKGEVTIDGTTYHFDETTGVCLDYYNSDGSYQDRTPNILATLADSALTAPTLYVLGDKWPCSETTLKENWEKFYKYMTVVYGPIADDFFTQGLTWKMTEETLAERVNEQYPEENLITMGIQSASEDTESCLDGLIHETGHIWLQNNNEALQFDYGQWIWEAQTILFEKIMAGEGMGENAILANSYDLYEYVGWEGLNGTLADGDKAQRSYSDFSAGSALYYLDTALSSPGTYDYWKTVSILRTKYCKENNCSSTNKETLSSIMDEAANGKTFDGLKPSEWLFTRNVSNINGSDGTYLTVFGNYFDNLGRDLRVSAYGFTREDGVETGLTGDLNVKLYDAKGNKKAEKTFTLDGNGCIEKENLEIDGRNVSSEDFEDYSAVRIVGETTVNGKKYTDTNYTIITSREDYITATDNRIFFILINEDETINTSLSSVSVKGAYNVDTSHLANGLLIVQVNQGEDVTLFGKTYTKPQGSRIIPVTVP